MKTYGQHYIKPKMAIDGLANQLKPKAPIKPARMTHAAIRAA